MSKCIVEGCECNAIARGLCQRHYRQFNRGRPFYLDEDKPKVCSHVGCKEPAFSKGLCKRHYFHEYYAKKRKRKNNDNNGSI